MDCKIKLVVAEFVNAFAIQIVEQDMEYTKAFKRIYPNGLQCDKWVVNSVSFPSIKYSEHKILLRTGFNIDKESLMTYHGNNSDEVLQEVLQAIHIWSTVLKKRECHIDKLKKYYTISY